LTNDDDLKKVNTKNDKLGFTHEKYQQFYKGVKIENAEYNIHLKDDRIESINGNFKKIEKLYIKPEISADLAFKKALDYINANEYLWQIPEMEEWIKKEKNDENASFLPKPELIIVKNIYGDGKEKCA
jgi:Zn-dependent metalloprotease